MICCMYAVMSYIWRAFNVVRWDVPYATLRPFHLNVRTVRTRWMEPLLK